MVHPLIFKHDKERKGGEMADQNPWSDEKNIEFKRHMADDTVVTEDLLLLP